MRIPSVALALFAISFFAGCTTYDGIPIYGAAHLLSSADYRAAVVVVKKAHSESKIHTFEVVSRDEVNLYFKPQTEGCYYTVSRMNGQWKENGGAYVLREPILFNGHENE
jgi:hypothetical protein